MARKAARPQPSVTQHLQPLMQDCPACGHRLWADYRNERTVATLDGLVGLVLDVRRYHHPACPRSLKPYRPEAEGRYALPQHEFGLDVIAQVGALRYAEHRSVSEIHRHLTGCGLAIAARTVTNLLDRYDELLAVSLTDDRRLLAAQAAGDPGHRWPPARRRPRGPVGVARLPVRRGRAGQEPAVGHHPGSVGLAA